MRELRRFAIDNVAQNPGMKLEFLAVDGCVVRLVRRQRWKGEVNGADKGKGKMTRGVVPVWGAGVTDGPGKASSPTTSNANAEANASTTETAAEGYADGGREGERDEDTSGDSDKENLDETNGHWAGLKIEMMEGIRFSDVPGVKIFRKDVLAGRL